MEETQRNDEISVHQINAGDGDGADVLFDFNGQLIAVSIFPHSSVLQQGSKSVNDHLIDLLGRVISPEIDDDEYEEIIDEVLDIILRAGRRIFAQAAPPVLPISASPYQDLSSLLSQKRLYFQLLETVDGTLTISPIHPDHAYTSSAGDACYNASPKDALEPSNSLPTRSADDVLIADIFVQSAGRVVCKVLVDGVEMFCKACGSERGLAGSDLERELRALQEIHKKDQVKYESRIRVPRLLGSIVHPQDGRLMGLLREWVPGQCLKDIQVAATTLQRRLKWASQICDTVNRLHSVDLTWGDGKTSNVIIDNGDNAWLVDFGGGFTEGWVDKERMNTAEGDEQAVANILKFLGVGSDGHV